jgi:pimeloyl-ACP methyl ester carboxylesterase
MRRLRTLIAVALGLILANTACADPLEVYGHPQRLVRLPDGRRMNLYCLGDKGPTVVLDAGLGGTSFSWGKVQPLLAGRFRACAYDRAGTGFSDPGPMPRDSTAMAQDLHELLKAARLPGPYLLVGHSLGGMTARLYASLYPKETAGLVLVDPAGPNQERRIYAALGSATAPDGNLARRVCLTAAEAGLKAGTEAYDHCVGSPPERWPAALRDAIMRMKSDPAYWRTEVSEFEELAGRDSEEVEAIKGYGDLPLVVLTAEETYVALPPAPRAVVSATWMQMHDEAAKLSTRGENRLVRGSGHLIPNDDPAAVVQAVDDVARMAKR